MTDMKMTAGRDKNAVFKQRLHYYDVCYSLLLFLNARYFNALRVTVF